MTASQPFVWSGRGAVSPAQLERERKVAAALAQSAQNPQTFWEGVQNATGKIGGSLLDWRADQDESTAKAAYGGKYSAALSGTPTMQELAMLAGDEWANPGQQQVVGALLSQAMAPPDAPEPFTLGENQIRYDGSGNIIASGPENVGPDTMIENNIGGTDKFYDELDKGLAGQTTDAIAAGANARSNNIRLGQLENLLSTAPQGAAGTLVQFAGDLGIPVEGADDLQAARAIINQLVPGQRAPGSGTMSDADLDLFKKSLPAIANQPGGNALIIKTAKAINGYNIEIANIADRVANREISPAEGRRLQAAVPNPLEALPSDTPKSVAPDHAQTVNINGTIVKIWAP